jgi:hypothetical protein
MLSRENLENMMDRNGAGLWLLAVKIFREQHTIARLLDEGVSGV